MNKKDIGIGLLENQLYSIQNLKSKRYLGTEEGKILVIQKELKPTSNDYWFVEFNDQHHKIKHVTTGLYLDIEFGSSDPKAKVVTNKKSENQSQSFNFKRMENGMIFLTVHVKNFALIVNDKSVKMGAYLIQDTYNCDEDHCFVFKLKKD